MNSFMLDLRDAGRALARSPGLTTIAALTLALGIGASTTLFTVIRGVLLNPLPYPRSNELVALYGRTPVYDRGPISYPNFLDWQRDNRAFSSIALYRNEDYNFTGREAGERLSGYMVSAKLLLDPGRRAGSRPHVPARRRSVGRRARGHPWRRLLDA